MRLLLDRGAFIEAKDSNEMTPLYLAAMWKHIAVMKLLLNRGSFVDAENNHGMRPLHIAAKEGESTVVQVLLRHKANFNF